MVDLFARTADRFVALLRELPAGAASLPVPGLKWTVAELAAHELTVLRRAVDPRRAATIAELSSLNESVVHEVRSRDLSVLADMVEAVVASGRPLRRAFPALWRWRIGRWLMLRLHFGLEADIPMAFAWPTGDMLVHGWELSQATGAHWDIPQDDAALCLEALVPQLGSWVRPEIIAGPVRSHVLSFGRDLSPIELTVGAGAYRARVVTGDGVGASEVDPVAFTLHMTGRTEPTGDPVTDDVASWFLPV